MLGGKGARFWVGNPATTPPSRNNLLQSESKSSMQSVTGEAIIKRMTQEGILS